MLSSHSTLCCSPRVYAEEICVYFFREIKFNSNSWVFKIDQLLREIILYEFLSYIHQQNEHFPHLIWGTLKKTDTGESQLSLHTFDF